MQKELAEERLMLAKIADGDQYAFELLFTLYKNKVYGYALKILQSESSAEEIVQETFIKLWLKRVHLRQVDNFGGYLRTVVKNETLNALKKVALQQKNYSIIQQEKTEEDSTTELSIEYRETKRLLESAIEKLPNQQRKVYNLCHVEGLKQKEVAEKLKISPLTVKVHLREAIKAIKTHLDTNGIIKELALLLFILK
ncbi:MAG: RNA polymerase sigma-70 factor [Pedobacter sp.]